MILCHSWGYNGFKRKYRLMTRHFLNWKLCLENELFDKYRVPVLDSHETVQYRPANFRDHFSQWDKFLKENIDALMGLSKQITNLSGIQNCIIKSALCRLFKDYEKTGRYQKRFNEGSWLSHDIHVVDDLLHMKMKKKEEKEMKGWKK
jgi:hypothetical protein